MRICILGAGLSSLTLAKALVNQNINVDILVQKKINQSNQYRTLGISKSNVEYLNKNIINVDKITWKLKKIEIFSENLKNEKLLNFENKKTELFSIIKNYKLFSLLEKTLSNSKYFNKIYEKNTFRQIKNYDLVINTDYFNPITKKYFSKKILKKYNSFAYVTLIVHEKINNDIATQIFTKKGPLAFLPISNYETSIVYSIHKLNNESNEDLRSLIDKYNFKYKIKKIQKIDSFELNCLSLRSYYHNNILAFGDLLHKIHPLAGQGFNMTIRDIRILTEIIKNKISLGLPIDFTVSREFEKNLKHKNFIFSNGIDFVHEFFNLERQSNSNILSKSVQILGKNHTINKMFKKIADKGIIF